MSGSPGPERPGRKAAMSGSPLEGGRLSAQALVLVVVGVAAVLGYALAGLAAPALHNRMAPWLLGRALGLAAYVSLFALVVIGLWYRHPWRLALRWLHPVALLRSHVALAVATVVLTLGHVAVLVSDRYAGVGWGAVVPGLATYRPAAVALGTVALYAGLAAGLTAGFAGSVARRVWLPVHRVAAVTLALAWAHGVLAGTDTPALRWLYAATGAMVLLLVTSRYLVERPTGVRPRTPGAS